MHRRAPHVLLVGLLLTGGLPAQATDPGEARRLADLARAAARFQRDAWPDAGLHLAGLRLPERGLPTLPELETAEDRWFDHLGDELLSVRERRARLPGRESGPPGHLSMRVLVATSSGTARDALLAMVGQTTARGASPWVLQPGETPPAGWTDLGEVRLGLPRPDGGLGGVAMVRGNVMVLLLGEGAGLPHLLPVAIATDALLRQAPPRDPLGPAVTGLVLAGHSPLPHLSLSPLEVVTRGGEELTLAFTVTGGGVQPPVQGHPRSYYAGDPGPHRIGVQAMDRSGYPSQITIQVVVGERAR